MRAALGYVVGAAVSLTGGIADLAYINVGLVPRLLESPAVAPPISPPISPPTAPPIEAAIEPSPPVEMIYESAAVVRFKTSSFELNEKARAEIDRVAKRLLGDAALVVRAEGHADKRGPSTFNQALSERRASVVARALETRGVEPGRIEVRGFG